MIIFNTLRINRMVMHRIVARTADVDHATVEYNDTLIPIDREIEIILKDRLSSSVVRFLSSNSGMLICTFIIDQLYHSSDINPFNSSINRPNSEYVYSLPLASFSSIESSALAIADASDPPLRSK